MNTSHVVEYQGVSFEWNAWDAKDLLNLSRELIYKEPKILTTISLLIALLNQKVLVYSNQVREQCYATILVYISKYFFN